MPRYSLRTLLILLAVGGLIVSCLGCGGLVVPFMLGVLDVSPSWEPLAKRVWGVLFYATPLAILLSVVAAIGLLLTRRGEPNR